MYLFIYLFFNVFILFYFISFHFILFIFYFSIFLFSICDKKSNIEKVNIWSVKWLNNFDIWYANLIFGPGIFAFLENSSWT